MKKRKGKSLLAYLLILLLLGSLAITVACSSGYSPSLKDEVSPGWDTGWDYGDGEAVPQEPPSSGILPDQGKNQLERKFIQDGTLSLRSSDIDKTYDSLLALTHKLGGRLVSYEAQSQDERRWINMKVALPFGKLPEFMDTTADHVTKIETKTVTSEEVTEAYYDTQTRIQSNENLIAHYRTMLNKAETIEETLLVQGRIDELTTELESLKGRLKLLDSLTQESRVDISIRMETDPTITKPDVTWKTLKWSDVGYLMKNAIQKVGIGIVLAFQYFLFFLVYASPFILLAGLIILLIILLGRRKRKRAAKRQGQKAAVKPQAYVHPDNSDQEAD